MPHSLQNGDTRRPKPMTDLERAKRIRHKIKHSAAINVQRRFRSRRDNLRRVPLVVHLYDMCLQDLVSGQGSIPSTYVTCLLKNIEDMESGVITLPTRHHEASPSWLGQVCTMPLNGCAGAPKLCITVMNESYATDDVGIAGGCIKLYRPSDHLSITLGGCDGLPNVTLSLRYEVHRGMAAAAFSTQIKEQVHASREGEGNRIREKAQMDLAAGMISVFGPVQSRPRTLRFCRALALRMGGHVLDLRGLIAEDFSHDYYSDKRILTADERAIVRAKERLPSNALVRLMVAARERCEGPVVLCDLPRSVFELNLLEGGVGGFRRAPAILRGLRLYEKTDIAPPVAVKFFDEGRLDTLLGDASRLGKGGLSIEPMVVSAMKIVSSCGLACSRVSYPTNTEALGIVASAVQRYLLCKRQKRDMEALMRVGAAQMLRRKSQLFAAARSHRTDATDGEAYREPLAGREKALRFLVGHVHESVVVQLRAQQQMKIARQVRAEATRSATCNPSTVTSRAMAASNRRPHSAAPVMRPVKVLCLPTAGVASHAVTSKAHEATVASASQWRTLMPRERVCHYSTSAQRKALQWASVSETSG